MSEVVKIKGVGPVLAAECAKAGFGSVEKIAGATTNELAAIRGVGELRAKSLISSAQILLNGSGVAPAAEPETVKAEPKGSKMSKGKNKKKAKNKEKKKDKKNSKSKSKKNNKSKNGKNKKKKK